MKLIFILIKLSGMHGAGSVVMFPDSKTRIRDSSGPVKVKYIASLGLAPYFQEFLIDDLMKTQAVIISSNKSYLPYKF